MMSSHHQQSEQGHYKSMMARFDQAAELLGLDRGLYNGLTPFTPET